MAFPDLMQRMSATTLARFGEAVTITPPVDSWTLFGPVEIRATYTLQTEAARPLDDGRQGTVHTLECAETDVTGVDVNCTATVRGKLHEILSIDPDGFGNATLLLGDPQETP